MRMRTKKSSVIGTLIAVASVIAAIACPVVGLAAGAWFLGSMAASGGLGLGIGCGIFGALAGGVLGGALGPLVLGIGSLVADIAVGADKINGVKQRSFSFSKKTAPIILEAQLAQIDAATEAWPFKGVQCRCSFNNVTCRNCCKQTGYQDNQQPATRQSKLSR